MRERKKEKNFLFLGKMVFFFVSMGKEKSEASFDFLSRNCCIKGGGVGKLYRNQRKGILIFFSKKKNKKKERKKL